MKLSTLKTVATVLLAILFFMPLVANFMLMFGADKETQQYAGLQLILIGIYNVPFLLVSLLGMTIGRTLADKSKEGAATISLAISILSSIAGSIVMFVWGLGSL